MTSVRGKFFRWIIGKQNINPITHPEMREKMVRMSARYSHTRAKKGYILECLSTRNGVKYQRLYKKGSTLSGKVIYYIHGGCYISGLTYNYRDFCAPLCEVIPGAEIILLDYRLSPEYRYPTQLNEALDLWMELTEHLGIKEKNIVVGGDSSGGNLALAMMLKLRDEGKPMPNSAFFLSPWTDMTVSGESYRSNYQKDVEIGDQNGKFDENTRRRLLSSYLFEYIGDAERNDPYVSPVFADYHGFPSTLLFAGEDEMLLDDARAVFEKMKKAGVRAIIETQPGMFHSYVLYMDYIPESSHSFKTLKRFIRQNAR